MRHLVFMVFTMVPAFALVLPARQSSSTLSSGSLRSAVHRSQTRRAALSELLPTVAMVTAETPVWVAPLRLILDPALLIGQFAMLLRIISSWDPEIKITKMPWLLVTYPTEPILRATRAVIPPAFGVDISPVVWLAVLSFFREIFFGQQGLFGML